jgi:hypothetical protein
MGMTLLVGETAATQINPQSSISNLQFREPAVGFEPTTC